VKGKGESKTGMGSGRGIMVPMGPGATATDSAQYLGLPRRYMYAGSSGQPSMSADTGFSTDGFGRVNKGYEMDVEMPPMFPDQDEEHCEEHDDTMMPISEARFRILENRYNMMMRNLGMKQSALRTFIREMIIEAKEDDLEGSIDHGSGFLQYSPDPYGSPTGQDYIGPEEAEELEAIEDEYIAVYKGDMGYRGYHTRPEDMREAALRRIIKRKISSMINELKKKKNL
jgi:hypothetical protein